ncbi:reverse transcriptase domain-containing protein [Trichonephila clavipes]|nr:reverse transcriptase domain-containing protein [Trichonephila clavipes]
METGFSKFFRSSLRDAEIILRAGQRIISEMNILVENSPGSSQIPKSNPQLLNAEIKKIARHENIKSMSFTRNGKIRFSTLDPVCAAQILSLEKISNVSVKTNILWEGITSRFLIFEIPLDISLNEIAKELQETNNFEIIEMRRFIKTGSQQQFSPVLITILGTTLPETVKLWFINHRIQNFIDKPRQCTTCFSFLHSTRFCQKTAICINCGDPHSGQCSNNSRCINCKVFMNIIQWNCRGLKNKFIWLNIPPFSEADIWVFQETFLSIHDNINLPNKIIFRKDREDRSGGGLLIAVPSNISAQQIPIQIQQTRELEILAIKIHVRNISFYIVNIYAPRGFNIILIKSFLESLMAPMIIFGDFNLHHPMWGSDHISRYSDEFVEWITDSNLVLLNTTVPTYRSSADTTSLLDLTVCSSSISGYCNSYVLDCSFESDHSPIITELSLLNSNKRIFKKVNWQAVMNQTHFIFNNPEVDSENLSDKISHVIANNIREIKVSNRSFPPWWNITDTDQKLNILQLNNRFITHPQLQADLFADYFASKNAYHEPLPLDFLYDKNNLLNTPFHVLELHSAIKSSKNTTPGADHVTAIFFKNLDQGQRDVILRYFQKLFDNAIVPDSWKHAILLPIPKPCKDKTQISSYRPIALTSVFSKIFERILANRISYYLTKEIKLHPQHYGFVPFKDSRSATYLVHKAVMNAKLQKNFL